MRGSYRAEKNPSQASTQHFWEPNNNVLDETDDRLFSGRLLQYRPK